MRFVVLCIEDTICVIAGQIVMVAMAASYTLFSLCRVLYQSHENYSSHTSILSAIMIMGVLKEQELVEQKWACRLMLSPCGKGQ